MDGNSPRVNPSPQSRQQQHSGLLGCVRPLPLPPRGGGAVCGGPRDGLGSTWLRSKHLLSLRPYIGRPTSGPHSPQLPGPRVLEDQTKCSSSPSLGGGGLGSTAGILGGPADASLLSSLPCNLSQGQGSLSSCMAPASRWHHPAHPAAPSLVPGTALNTCPELLHPQSTVGRQCCCPTLQVRKSRLREVSAEH